MNFAGFVGPSYSLPSKSIDCQRAINLVPEIVESGTGKEASTICYRSRAGQRKIITVGNGPIRLIHTDPFGKIFVASGNEMYTVNYDRETSIWSSTKIGDLDTHTGIINARSSLTGVDIKMTKTVFVDGESNYIYLYSTGTIFHVEPTFRRFDAGPIIYEGTPTATHVAFIDGFFIYNVQGTNQFTVSYNDDFQVDPLSFASAEGDPDLLVGMIENHRDLWLFNEKTAEVWVNTGNAEFPFERVAGGFIERGCVAKHSIAKIEGLIFWLGRDDKGQGIVYAAQGLTPQRVSTTAMEQAIQKYADISTATSLTYQRGGHIYYQLSFAEGTWTYDLTTKMWHEPLYANQGALERNRADVIDFNPDLSLHMIGDYQNGNIYVIDEDYMYDDSAPIIKRRISPHISNSSKMVFYNSLQIDMEVGVGIDGIGQGEDPKAMLRISNDGSKTWSNELEASLGKIGNFKNRVIWNRLGRARDRVFEFTVSDPVKVNIVGAELEITAGAS